MYLSIDPLCFGSVHVTPDRRNHTLKLARPEDWSPSTLLSFRKFFRTGDHRRRSKNFCSRPPRNASSASTASEAHLAPRQVA